MLEHSLVLPANEDICRKVGSDSGDKASFYTMYTWGQIVGRLFFQ